MSIDSPIKECAKGFCEIMACKVWRVVGGQYTCINDLSQKKVLTDYWSDKTYKSGRCELMLVFKFLLNASLRINSLIVFILEEKWSENKGTVEFSVWLSLCSLFSCYTKDGWLHHSAVKNLLSWRRELWTPSFLLQTSWSARQFPGQNWSRFVLLTVLLDFWRYCSKL